MKQQSLTAHQEICDGLSSIRSTAHPAESCAGGIRPRSANRGPLADRDLTTIYERLIDVMRKIQKEEFIPKPSAGTGDTELEAEIND